ncbi:MAG: tyrosine--tRNA ligase [Pelagibacteraceae bacterium]|nr:tyrosine--tRNA ligase [Pelagibacteraceae bacterium]MBT4645436.1 tyrosine--tRNA ligase [Pelagibacteraceae bacterium]MBT5214969.1 tyrosine--tRNA ligase [Pelagibacteraceae bacterium]
MKFKSDFIKEIQSRGFIYQSSDIEQLDDLINKKKITAYIGFDITSDSLHIGSLVQLMLLHWLDFYDHKTIALVGGGTTLVGDPSGKDDTRKIMTLDQINQNIIKIEKIFGQFINLNKNGSVINNYDWLSELNYINFLRDVGSKLTLNKMLTYESVKNRLEREQPLTFLEFNYMLLQSYDFYYLKKNYNCLLQMGGSDQWGNIINGIDLIRKMLNEKAYALTSPLITNTDGSKMGKTAKGAIWLNKEKLSNFEFYQFWRNINDEDIERFLMLFTNINLNEIQKLSQLKGQEINEAKKILAYEVTKITRGITSANEAKDIANNIFNKKKIDERILTFEIESIELQKNNFSILDAIEKLNLSKSRSDTKRLIKSRGIKINDEMFSSPNLSLELYSNLSEIKISVGKKNIGILKIKK